MSDEQAVQLQRDGNIGIAIVSRPPVNAIDVAARRGLIDAIDAFERDDAIAAVVICCKGKTFFSGADMAEFDTGIAAPTYRETLVRLEQCRKPVVAVMHGTVLGGGLEVAMACHWRVAREGTALGLPEISLGVIPGAGGTQRLPRLVGMSVALDMLISGSAISAERAEAVGLIDGCFTGDPLIEGIAMARKLVADGGGVRRTCDTNLPRDALDPVLFDEVLVRYKKSLQGRTTQKLLVDALQAVTENSFEQGLDVEAALSQSAVATRESAALRHAFFAERKCAKIPTSLGTAAARPVRAAAVIGAGTMGSGITIALLSARLPVVLVDANPAALARGLDMVSGHFQSAGAKGRMTADAVAETLGRLQTADDLAAVREADLVVEAVFEDLALKQSLVADLDKLLPAHAIIASNTSSLSIAEIAKGANHPERVLGMHFFSPANVMRLVEVIRGERSSIEAIETAMAVVRSMRKIGVLAGDAFGFIGNKMMLDGYFREAEQLLLEGATPAQIDCAMEAFGFAMGPCRVNDLGGMDVGAAVREQLFKRESRLDPYCVVSNRLAELGRLGQKTGAGFYRYESGARGGVEDPEVSLIIQQLAAERGIAQRAIDEREIIERCVLQLINVGAGILSQKVAYRASDIDVVWLAGYGFPRYLGGPMFYADTLGLDHVAQRIRHYHDLHGHYWTPAPLIQELAQRGSSFQQLDA